MRVRARCGNRVARCTAETPALEPDGPTGHLLRCFNPVGAQKQPEPGAVP